MGEAFGTSLDYKMKRSIRELCLLVLYLYMLVATATSHNLIEELKLIRFLKNANLHIILHLESEFDVVTHNLQ